MADSEADSDATVGHEPASEIDEAGGEKSPSFLNTQAAGYEAKSQEEREVESSQPMSPELPLAVGTNANSLVPNKPAGGGGGGGGGCESVVSSGGGESTTGVLLVEGSEEETGVMATSELEDVVQLQSDLDQSLNQTNGLSSAEVRRIQMKVEKIEKSLREISVANQDERKRLALAHSSLSQEHSQSNSQSSQSGRRGGGGESNESLRQQLTRLAARQKTLLKCFKTQKELSERLNAVVQGAESKGSGPKRRRTSAAIPNLLQHLVTQPPIISSGSSTAMNDQLPIQIQTTGNQSKPLQTKVNQSQTLQPIGNQSRPLKTKVNQSQTLQPTGNQPRPLETTMDQSRPLQTTKSKNKPSQQTVPRPAKVIASKLPTTGILSQKNVVVTQSQMINLSGNQVTPTTSTTALPSKSLPSTLQSQTLAVPVALQTLLKHGYIQSSTCCLTTTLMGCEFSCSLMEDGTLCGSQSGSRYKTPNQWLQNCWAQLGQHRTNLRTNHTYRNVNYRGTPLMSICEEFNRRQVSIVASHQVKMAETDLRQSLNQLQGSMNTASRNSLVNKSSLPQLRSQAAIPAWNLDSLLKSGQLLLLEENSILSGSLPPSFWDCPTARAVPLTPQLVEQFEKDLTHW